MVLGANIGTIQQAAGASFQSLSFDGSSDYLSISNANWGSYDRSQFALIFSVYCDSLGAALGVFSRSAGGGAANEEFFVQINTNGSILLEGRDSSLNLIDPVSATGVITAGAWHAVMIHVDVANATAADRTRMWVDGSEVSVSGTKPSNPINTTTNNAAIGTTRHDSATSPFDGLIHQPTFISGALPSAGDVFNGSSGKLKDVSSLTDVHSHIGALEDVTTDTILSPDWTNNGLVTVSASTP